MSHLDLGQTAKIIAKALDISSEEANDLLKQRLTFSIGVGDAELPASSDAFVNKPVIASIGLSASAANNAHAQVFNPADSGVIVVLDQAIVSKAGTGQFFIMRHDTALTATTSVGFRDFRIAGPTAVVPRFVQNAGVLGSQIGAFFSLANTSLVIPMNFVIGGGQGVLVANATVNEAMDVTFYWTEYAR